MKLASLILAAATLVASIAAASAQAVPPVQDACRTAEACQAQATRVLAQPAPGATSALARGQDRFYWFGRINMASTVANVEKGIIPAALAGPIARGVAHSIDQGNKPDGKRPTRRAARPRRSSPPPPAPTLP